MKAVPTSRYLLFAGIALVGCAVDLLTKRWAFASLGMPHQRPSYWLWDEIFGFTTSLNEGALFGIGQGQGLLFSGLSVIAAVGIVYWLFIAKAARDLLLTVALGSVTAGIFGNLYDRLGLPGLTWTGDGAHQGGQSVYAVRDWLHFKIDHVIDWPIFNVADSLLVCGAALLIWHALRFAPTHAHADAAER
ncbi:MAG: signal peptidase II [Planctomycetia bacterium]|nr:signal peptidase II [Planctomycetia bacterium]